MTRERAIEELENQLENTQIWAWNEAHTDGEDLVFPMEEINQYFADMDADAETIINDTCGNFHLQDDYFTPTIYGVESIPTFDMAIDWESLTDSELEIACAYCGIDFEEE